MSEKLPVGTRIRFTKTLDEPANEEHPHLVYADRGELGEIVDGGRPAREGHWAKTESNPPFGVSRDEFEVITQTAAGGGSE
jgi:hypothetical protein